MLKHYEGVTLGFGHENSQKVCAFYLNQRGHTLEEFLLLKVKICNLIDTRKILHMWV